MTDVERFTERVWNFWAELASVATWEDLRESGRLRLAEDLKALCQEILVDKLKALDQGEEATGAVALDLGSAMAHLPELLGLARDVIARLVDGELVQPPRQLAACLRWYLLDGRMKEQWDTREAIETTKIGIHELIHILFNAIHSSSFPFRRCEECRRVFVRYRHQRYCSPTCAVRATETARRESKREYMRKRREQTKVQRQKKHHPRSGKER